MINFYYQLTTHLFTKIRGTIRTSTASEGFPLGHTLESGMRLVSRQSDAIILADTQKVVNNVSVSKPVSAFDAIVCATITNQTFQHNYIDPTVNIIYGPTASEAWQTSVSLVSLANANGKTSFSCANSSKIEHNLSFTVDSTSVTNCRRKVDNLSLNILKLGSCCQVGIVANTGELLRQKIKRVWKLSHVVKRQVNFSDLSP